MHKIHLLLPNDDVIPIELDDTIAPKTVRAILGVLSISVIIHVWGKELYTDPIPIDQGPENSKSLVDVMDVACWPPGNALCLFFGPTPIGQKGEIRPYSPVNIIGKILGKSIFPKNVDGSKVTFRV